MNRIIVNIILLMACVVQIDATENIALKGLNCSNSSSELSLKYVLPVRVVHTYGEVVGSEHLLTNSARQVSLSTSDVCAISSTGGKSSGILLDFGKEIHGGLKLYAAVRATYRPVKIRIRFGESVAEAMTPVGIDNATNDHAMRDFVVEVPWLGSIEVGNSAYRFVNIELAEPDIDLNLALVEGIFKYRDIPYLGRFKCDNPRLNQIWETGAYTVHLNMQEYLWDGVKRDRLVWVGDMHPEVMTINSVFGRNEVVNKSLDFVRDNTPLPGWMNGMCSYSLWWIIIQRDLYMHCGDLDYLKQQESYLDKLADQIIENCSDGKENFKNGERFLDWPTSDKPEIIHAGLHALAVMSMEAASELGKWLGNTELSSKCADATGKLRKYLPDNFGNKQASALLALANIGNADALAKNILRDGADGFSTFYGFYMLEALAKAGRYDEAMKIISDYWGGMIDLGATTFWEDVSMGDLRLSSRIDSIPAEGQFNFHSKGGRYCYRQLRNSLCHGWASGPTSWLSRHVLGIIPIEPGFRKIKIEPHLGSLKQVEGSIPTPYGVIEVRHHRDKNNKIKTDVKLPKGIKLVK